MFVLVIFDRDLPGEPVHEPSAEEQEPLARQLDQGYSIQKPAAHWLNSTKSRSKS
jgi:hypothetical protein